MSENNQPKRRGRPKRTDVEETRESLQRKKAAEERKDAKENNKVSKKWYEVKYGKKLIEVVEKKTGSRYRRYVCNVDKPNGRAYVEKIKSEGAIIKGDY